MSVVILPKISINRIEEKIVEMPVSDRHFILVVDYFTKNEKDKWGHANLKREKSKVV